MKAKVVKTEKGWEPAFFNERDKVWDIEPGFARPTREEAQRLLDKDTQQARTIDATQRACASGMDYACGYRD